MKIAKKKKITVTIITLNIVINKLNKIVLSPCIILIKCGHSSHRGYFIMNNCIKFTEIFSLFLKNKYRIVYRNRFVCYPAVYNIIHMICSTYSLCQYIDI